MPTTSNFGWTTPADTDLVKDGAAAIRTLAGGIDTSLVDLKGGTTGQILSKATNTDLDYTWINNDQGDITEVQAGTGISVASGTGPIPVVTNTVATTFDAKGDLVVGTGADTFAKLTVGTNGYTLVADSGAATGLAYSAGIPVVLNAQTATYTVVLGDAYKLVTMSVASANDFQIPTNANVAYPVGTVINVIQIGAGQTTIKAVTSGTTTISSTGATATAPKLRAQFSAASCIKVATDTWYVVGDIA
jgi:hypothetical protein